MKRIEILTLITKRTKKTFTKDFRVMVDGHQGRPVKLVLNFYPNGVGRDADKAMTLEVLVKVERKCSELKEIAQLKLNSNTVIGKKLVSAKQLTRPLENFIVYDFLPHEIITQTHARHIDMQFEGFINCGIESDLRSSCIEHPERENTGNLV